MASAPVRSNSLLTLAEDGTVQVRATDLTIDRQGLHTGEYVHSELTVDIEQID